MTSKAETTFAKGVHVYLPGDVYAEKMYNPFRGGTPDFYFEGRRRACWIEYKFVVLPKRDTTLIVPNLSELQIDWLARNHANGFEPRVIVGCGVGRGAGGVIFDTPKTWVQGMPCAQFKAALMSRQELADFITRIVS